MFISQVTIWCFSKKINNKIQVQKIISLEWDVTSVLNMQPSYQTPQLTPQLRYVKQVSYDQRNEIWRLLYKMSFLDILEECLFWNKNLKWLKFGETNNLKDVFISRTWLLYLRWRYCSQPDVKTSWRQGSQT